MTQQHTKRVSARELLQRLREGEPSAANQIYQRYSERLWRLAEKEIGDRLRRRVGPEDVLQSVFRTFFVRAAKGEYSIDHSLALHNLLARMTHNKVCKQAEFHCARKRDMRAESHEWEGQSRPEEVLDIASGEDEESSWIG